MNGRFPNVIRFADRNDVRLRPAAYWRTRPYAERLAEMFALHRQGNALFRGGNPPFVHTLKVRNVGGA